MDDRARHDQLDHTSAIVELHPIGSDCDCGPETFDARFRDAGWLPGGPLSDGLPVGIYKLA